MSSGVDKVKLHIHSGGEWMQENDSWEYVSSAQSVRHSVKLRTNITHEELVAYCARKCDLQNFVDQMKIVYKLDGSLYEIGQDADVYEFMEYAAESNIPPTLYVYINHLKCGEVYVGGGSSNVGGGSYVGGSSYVGGGSSYVEETQEEEEEVGEEEVREEEEENVGSYENEEERRRFAGFSDDEAHVFEISETDEEEELGVEIGSHANKSFGGINDFFDMPLPLETTELSITTNEPVPYNRSNRIVLHQMFETKDEMIVQLGTKFIEEGFQYKTPRSSKTRYEVKCIKDECSWRMMAKLVGEGVNSMFQIRKLTDVHTCSQTQLNPNHRQANTKILGHILKDKFIDANRVSRPNDIIHDLHQQYGVNIGYHQGWRARWRALGMVRGTPEESFTRLPRYLYNVEYHNPHTFTRIKTDSVGRFEKCFVALGCAVRITMSYVYIV